MGTLGAVTGFDLPVGPYCFRRGNGEALDNSSLISDSQRNLILQHASSAVFQPNYLSRYITYDIQAIYRGLTPQTAVIRAASGMTPDNEPIECPYPECDATLNDKEHLQNHTAVVHKTFT